MEMHLIELFFSQTGSAFQIYIYTRITEKVVCTSFIGSFRLFGNVLQGTFPPTPKAATLDFGIKKVFFCLQQNRLHQKHL